MEPLWFIVGFVVVLAIMKLSKMESKAKTRTSKWKEFDDTIKLIEWHQSQWQKALLAGDKDMIEFHKKSAKQLTEQADEILKEMEK